MTNITAHTLAPPRRRFSLILGLAAASLAWSTAPIASAQTQLPGQTEAATVRWQKMPNQPPFNTDSANLLTDGTVLVHQYNSPNWWRLTPDINGSYLNGSWSQAASMSSDYAPLYFANAVLPDGRVIVEGGEYNFLSQNFTNKGAIYDPVANSWTTVAPPAGWNNIGDSPGIIQPNGVFTMGQGGFATTRQVNFNASNLTWTALTSTGKSDTFSEEGFGLLPNGKFLTVDTQNIPNSEIFDPATGKWTSAGSTGVSLPDRNSLEVGPQILMPDGNIVAFGGTPHTSIYNPTANTWTPGPDYPNANDSADGPASLLPDGNVVLMASPGVFQGSITVFVFDGTTFTQAPPTQSSSSLQSWQTRTLLLPTGQMMYMAADGSTKDVELLRSNGKPKMAWRPTIAHVPATLTRGTTVTISGRQFNGLSGGSDYGDDALSATNYPIVRITNLATKHVFYGRTHNHSTMAVATGNTMVSTKLDVPANAETGASYIEVVANGIASRVKPVTIQ